MVAEAALVEDLFFKYPTTIHRPHLLCSAIAIAIAIATDAAARGGFSCFTNLSHFVWLGGCRMAMELDGVVGSAGGGGTSLFVDSKQPFASLN